jgi:hypothetical protein
MEAKSVTTKGMKVDEVENDEVENDDSTMQDGSHRHCHYYRAIVS